MIQGIGQRWRQAIMCGNGDGDGSNLCGDGRGCGQGPAGMVGDKLSSPRSSMVDMWPLRE